MEVLGSFADVQYVYRGTTLGWPGNMSLQQEHITCATADPLVATLFAILARNYGQALVMAARRSLFGELVGSPNYFSVIESAVNLRLSPVEFARIAEIRLGVDKSIAILRELGFQDMPIRLRGKSALQKELEDTHLAGHRLNDVQIHLFNLRMFETES
jgi:hypothetical protein